MPQLRREELRQKILAVVQERKKVDDIALWRAYAPDYLPWAELTKELIALDREQKLRRIVEAPGHIVLYDIAILPAPPPEPLSSPRPRKRSRKT